MFSTFCYSFTFFPVFSNKLNFADENFREICCAQNFEDGEFFGLLCGPYFAEKINIDEI